MDVNEFLGATQCLALELPETVFKDYSQRANEIAGALAAANKEIDTLTVGRQAALEHYETLYQQFDVANKEIERLKAENWRLAKLEDGIREALAVAQAEWDAVGRHPASRYAEVVGYYQRLLNLKQPAPLEKDDVKTLEGNIGEGGVT